MNNVSQLSVVLNFLSVYIVWGSTYLAIKYAVVDFPPLLMASIRFFLAALLMFLIGRIRDEPSLLKPDRKIASISGILLVFGNGLVCIAEMTIPSGFAAIVIGTTPIFIILLNWFSFEKVMPNFRQVFGVIVSFIGIILLTQGESSSNGSSYFMGIALLIFAVLSWSVGTLMQRRAGKLPNIFSFSGYQLLIGSIVVGVLGLLMGELAQFDISKITTTGILAVLYLVFFGSAIGFSSYIWLSRNVEPTKVATYAVVNPVVAVWLGWLIAGEKVDLGTMLYSSIVLIGLYFVIFKKKIFDKKIAPSKAS